MTDDDGARPERLELGNLAERARGALAYAEKMGDLSPDDHLQVLAANTTPGKIQHAYLNHAATLALVSIAESLETIVAQM
jgi:hypothetical protein